MNATEDPGQNPENPEQGMEDPDEVEVPGEEELMDQDNMPEEAAERDDTVDNAENDLAPEGSEMAEGNPNPDNPDAMPAPPVDAPDTTPPAEREGAEEEHDEEQN